MNRLPTVISLFTVLFLLTTSSVAFAQNGKPTSPPGQASGGVQALEQQHNDDITNLFI